MNSSHASCSKMNRIMNMRFINRDRVILTSRDIKTAYRLRTNKKDGIFQRIDNTLNPLKKRGDRMKNMIFLGSVVALLTVLFSLHYGVHLIDDTTLKISLLISLIVVLIARKKWKITFTTAE